MRRRLALLAPLLLVACSREVADTEPCPAGTIRSGLDCLPDPSDTGAADTSADADDTGGDADPADTAVEETGGDTDPADTTVADTTADTDPADTDPADTAVEDTGGDTALDTEPVDTTVADTGGSTSPTSLPFVVDSYWVPSGFMGDGETPGGIAVTEDACGGTRAGEGLGACRKFSWTPGRVGWAGVFWQYPEANWGTLPGLAIPAGATEVTVWAWGERGGEEVKFLAGIGGAAADGFAAESAVFTLTTTPTQYRVALPTATLPSEMVGPFGWVSGDTGGVSFFVDDIQWR